MNETKPRFSPGVWLPLLIAMSAGQTAACMKTTDFSPGAALPRDARAEVVLNDGTSFRVLHARTTEGGVCGDVQDCAGPSCAAMKPGWCVGNDQIATLKVRSVDADKVALGVGAAAVGVGVIAAIALTASSTRSSSGNTGSSSSSGSSAQGARFGSCPRVYSWNGASYRLDSGTFGVSYFPAAQRTDFDRLDHLTADQGKYKMRLVNEQPETEHTDLVRLRVVDHPAGTRIVPSASGKIHTFRDEARELPSSARDFRGADALDLVNAKDDREWSSDTRGREAGRDTDARDGLRLSFTKPRDAKTARLRVAAHNTDWAGDMLGYLLAQRGNTLPAWFTKMNTDASARAELSAFLVREGMLNVRVKTPSGWSTRGVFWAAGSEIVKEEAFEISVADVPGEKLEIELESALDFWSIDAASIAYGKEEPIVVRDLAPSRARTNDGRDITSMLARVDSVRFDTVRGDTAELSFDAPADPAPGSVRSFVLETTGYYVPEVAPALLANPKAMDEIMATPFAASRLALSFRLSAPR
jgi:hypothetical protein